MTAQQIAEPRVGSAIVAKADLGTRARDVAMAAANDAAAVDSAGAIDLMGLDGFESASLRLWELERNQVLACNYGNDLLSAQPIGHGRGADLPAGIE